MIASFYYIRVWQLLLDQTVGALTICNVTGAEGLDLSCIFLKIGNKVKIASAQGSLFGHVPWEPRANMYEIQLP